ncbi:hypothetical protein G9A89_023341 [Geosiphon pyriformis]|nr:hypothetical protein G9A89_023341 [Geosiphon pyriformis]
MNLDDRPVQLTINQDFAKRYEERKRGEELSKLKEKYGDRAIKEDEEESSSSSEEEDEFGELVTPEVDLQIMKTITAIRARNPKVYDPRADFFASQLRTEKPTKITDYQRNILLENGGVLDEEFDKKDRPHDRKRELTHVEEQEQLKNEFKAAVVAIGNNEENEEEFLLERWKTAEQVEVEAEEYRQFLLENMMDDKTNLEAIQQWQNIKDPNVDEDEAFLKEYVLNRGWIDKDAARPPTYEELTTEHHDKEDEEFEEAVDKFESQYNFRFEESGSTKIVTHAREIEGSVRRKNTKRKLKRKEREEHKEEEKSRKIEELKRLKNLKMKEIHDKLIQIKEITGNSNVGFDEVDLEEDFDPEKYDQKMETVFNEEYYAHEGEEEIPEWDDIDINDIIVKKADTSQPEIHQDQNNDEKSEDEHRFEEEQYEEQNEADNFIMDADYLPGGIHFKETKSRKMKNEKKKGTQNFEKYLDEYYQLDYEDIVADIPVRFKYSQVKPTTFGLSPAEILLADDKDLNEFVSLKKLAPFRPEQSVKNDEKKYSKKKRLQQFRKKLKRLEREQPLPNKSWSVENIKRKMEKQDQTSTAGATSSTTFKGKGQVYEQKEEALATHKEASNTKLKYKRKKNKDAITDKI